MTARFPSLTSLATALPSSVASSSRSASTFAGAAVHLGNLSPAPGSNKNDTRLGRGRGSTKGGTAGRGHKGQLSRSGGGKGPSFEGGQTPLTRRFPKRGFVNFQSRDYAPLPLHRLQSFIAQGRIDPDTPITTASLTASKVISHLSINKWAGIKLLGPIDESLPLPALDVQVARISKGAAEAVEQAGGKVTAVYQNTLALKQAIWPQKFIGREVAEAKPVRKTDILYYSDPNKHGYLASKLAATESSIPKVDQH